MGKSVSIRAARPSSSATRGVREKEQRCFAAALREGAERTTADDRPARATPRFTWVLNHDTLEQQYVH
jgi:hypothetical protein